MPPPPRDCPCHSGTRYRDCCGPFHAGIALPPTPEALMRSRYSAFARGLVPYLRLTLATTNPDSKDKNDPRPDDLTRLKYLGLKILHASETSDGARGEVLFTARIYDRGSNQSFAELSQFVREGDTRAWRYESGKMIPTKHLPASMEGFTRDTFLARFANVPT
jgi:SEC-C motif-containing protein